MADRVQTLTAGDLHWPFDGAPYYYINRSYTRVDPFPCYAHNEALVRSTLKHVESCVDIEHKPTVYIMSHESPSRTNGWATKGYGTWNKEEERNVLQPGEIVLSGKRIPPHPGMTRYLVGHEYGHHVDYNLCELRKLNDNGLDDEYAKLRQLPDGYDRYGGGRWHSNVGELIANDFRILVADVEPDFWPHPGYARPESVVGLEQWWEESIACLN